MVRVLADNIDELYMVENWLECGILNTPVLNEVTYPGREVEVNYDVVTTRPHFLMRDNTWNQIAAIAYLDGTDEVELVKPFREDDKITIENGKVILPPIEPIQITTEEPVEEVADDSGTV